jgi:hypothetical protein
VRPGPTPTARSEHLVVRELADETLVYDVRRHKAHCLNRTAALVWRACDGRTSITEIAARVAQELDRPSDEALVLAALAQLERARLLIPGALHQGSGPPRREALRRLGWGLAAPAVVSILAPTLAEAVTCVTKADCGNPSKCSQGPDQCCDRRPCCEKPRQKCLPKGGTAGGCGCEN